MRSKADKADKKNQGKTANAAALQRNGGKNNLQMADNRKVSSSQAGLQMMIDHSPRMAVQRREIERTFDMPVQQQGPEEEEELLQGKFETVQRHPEEEELMQGKFETIQRQGPEEEEELLQGKFRSGPSDTLQTMADASENKTGMPDNLKAGLENLSGISMDDVKVHYNSPKPTDINAHAFTQGKDIHIASGQEKHLPHEGWHAVQQMQGRVQPTGEVAGLPVNDSAELEKEADVMGGKAV
jgi:hypothetical protein